MDQLEYMKRRCDTGDLVLFSGSSFSSVGVELATGSWWSHVGMVIRSDEDELYLFDSSARTNMVTLSPLHRVLNSYSGVYCVRPLKRPMSTMRKRRLCGYINETLGKPFEQDTVKWISAAAYSWIAIIPLIGQLLVHADRIPRSDSSSFICSELIVGCFLSMGYDLDDRMPISIVPDDMTSDSTLSIFGCTSAGCLYDVEHDVHRDFLI